MKIFATSGQNETDLAGAKLAGATTDAGTVTPRDARP
jgi:hypothetical protein